MELVSARRYGLTAKRAICVQGSCRMTYRQQTTSTIRPQRMRWWGALAVLYGSSMNVIAQSCVKEKLAHLMHRCQRTTVLHLSNTDKPYGLWKPLSPVPIPIEVNFLIDLASSHHTNGVCT